MGRKEEINLAASCHIAASNNEFKEYYEGFIAGAKWADKTMIDKACEWLKNSLYETQDICGYKEVASFDSCDISEFIEYFKCAMEA